MVYRELCFHFTGYNIEVRFKPAIGMMVKKCSDIFEAATVTKLGPKAKCTSLSRQQLKISRISGSGSKAFRVPQEFNGLKCF